MLYLFTDKNQLKLLYIRKTLLSQYESSYYQKIHQIDLQTEQTVNIDLFASAVKEAVTFVSPHAAKDKEVQLILPQESFHFLRAEVPSDIAPSAISSFIMDKARAQLMIDLDACLYDFLLEENDVGKQVLFFAINKELVQKYYDALKLVNLHVTAIVPEVLTYYKLFEKTLRKDKKEYILYIVYEPGRMGGYVYDTYGPLEAKRIAATVTDSKPLGHILKKYAQESEAQGKKLNRLILSGEESEKIRQDTFTKEVGVWTNPLKRIIPQFYQEYLKLLVSPQANQPIPFLEYDVCIGAFIFSLENKYFSIFKKKFRPQSSGRSMPRLGLPRLPWKELAIFVGSFILSFIVLSYLMQNKNFKFPTIPNLARVTPTATPSATPIPSPTPAIKRSDVKVKILNGSGIAGKASELKDILTKAGYEDILTGNADNFDYQTTEIQVKKSKSEIIPIIKSDIKDVIATPKVTSLKEDETADVIIIIGTDIK